jgi:hypothetical protein
MRCFRQANMSLWAALCAVPTAVWAASAQVHGQGGVVGEYHTNMPPKSTTFQGFRMPFGLTFEGRASNSLSLFLDLRFTYNNSPAVADALGNRGGAQQGFPDAETEDKARGRQPQPFNLENGRGENISLPTVGFAFIQYASEVGLFKVGRMPRHWGLGLWRNAEWKVEGGTLTTTDSLSATFDLTSAFSGTVSFDKYNEGSPTSTQDDADAFTVEALLADDPTDVSASGVTRQIGISFSSYEHKFTSTRIRTLDLFAKINAGEFGVEGEVVFPSGDTKSLTYGNMGGSSTQCPEQKNPEKYLITCDGQRYEGLASVLKMKWLFAGAPSGPDGVLSINSVEASRKRLSTALRSSSHLMTFQGGYARGDSDAFDGVQKKDNTIRTTPFHPNVRPALWMFSTTQQPVNGMPGNTVANTIYTRLDYTYESSGFGTITPALIWARLDQANTKTPVAGVGVGRNKNLGYEFDLSYFFTTQDNLKLGVEGGVWFPGAAWAEKGNKRPDAVYGIRTSASTSF